MNDSRKTRGDFYRPPRMAMPRSAGPEFSQGGQGRRIAKPRANTSMTSVNHRPCDPRQFGTSPAGSTVSSATNADFDPNPDGAMEHTDNQIPVRRNTARARGLTRSEQQQAEKQTDWPLSDFIAQERTCETRTMPSKRCRNAPWILARRAPPGSHGRLKIHHKTLTKRRLRP